MEILNDFEWLNGELVPGEAVLWKGKPNEKKLLSAQDIFLIPFSIMWCGFAIFWEATVLFEDAPIIFKLWGIPFVCVGLYIVFGRFIHQKYILKNTRYALTTHRAIRYKKGKISSCDYRNEPSITVKVKKDGTGTITFGSHTPYGLKRGLDFINDPIYGVVEFTNIPDVQNVHRIINQQKISK